MSARTGCLLVFTALACFGQTSPISQAITKIQSWKGSLKVARMIPTTTMPGPGGAPSTFSAVTVFTLQLDLGKFDGRKWTGTATGTFTLDESLTTTFPCTTMVHAQANTTVSSGNFELILGSGDTFSFANFDDPAKPMTITTISNCSGSNMTTTSSLPTIWYFAPSTQGLPITLNGNNLKGTATTKGNTAIGAFIVDHTVTWDLNGPSKELEMIVEPSGYTSWRPQANRDGGSPGNTLPVNVTLRYTDGSSPTNDNDKAKKFTFELLETSKEPGVAINWPRDASDSDFDMKIAMAGDLTFTDRVGRQRADKTITGAPVLTASVTIESFDWGGWSRLKATAETTDGRTITGYLVNDKNQTEVRLPRRSASSFIADAWKESKGITAADSADDETDPAGDGSPGDGLTLYEEYRGFYENTEHKEGDTRKKDYFAINLGGPDGSGGLALFHRISGLAVHGNLLQTELSFDRVINKNKRASPHRVDQHGVILKVQGYEGYAQASRADDGVSPSTPRDFQYIGLPVSLPRRQTASAAVSYGSATVAHELLHTVNVYHHGEVDETVFWIRGPGDTVLENALTPIRVLREDGTDVTARVLADIDSLGQAEVVFTRWIGMKGGQHSGYENCVMRYDNAQAYRSDADASVRYTVGELPGASLCVVATGSNVNDSGHQPQSRYGSANSPRGACKRQILVNDGVSPPRR